MTSLLAFTIIFYIPAFLVLLKNLFWSIYLWQIKEYKLFRLWDYLKFDAEPGTKNKILRFIPFIFLIPFIVFLINPNLTFLLFAWIPVMGFYIYEAMDLSREIIGKRLVKPKKSIRNILIFLGSFIVLSLPMILTTLFILNTTSGMKLETTTVTLSEIDLKELSIKEDSGIRTIPLVTLLITYLSMTILVLDIFMPLIVGFMVVLTHPLSKLMRYRVISKAKARLKDFPNLKVIAITGSYGKTTTKEILYDILSKKFQVVKTPKNQNTDVGVAMAVLAELKEGTEVFIAEMGAYRLGEIKSTTNVLRPNISVVTGVNEQHISLFGSIENTFKAKYELIEALPDDGVAILSGNNEFTLRMAEKSRHKEVLYFTNLDQGEVATNVNIADKKSDFPDQSRSTLVATHIKKTENGINFVLKQNNNDFEVKVKLSDLHNVSNLLASIAAALEVGMSLQEILKVLPEIDFNLPHLNEKDGVNDSLIIDDSYNTNPDGFVSAIEKLSGFKHEKKILVTEGILELGQYKREIYLRIIPAIVKYCTKLITKDKVLFDELKKLHSKFNASFTKDSRSMAREIIDSVDSETLILLEGNISPQVKEKIAK